MEASLIRVTDILRTKEAENKQLCTELDAIKATVNAECAERVRLQHGHALPPLSPLPRREFWARVLRDVRRRLPHAHAVHRPLVGERVVVP